MAAAAGSLPLSLSPWALFVSPFLISFISYRPGPPARQVGLEDVVVVGERRGHFSLFGRARAVARERRKKRKKRSRAKKSEEPKYFFLKIHSSLRAFKRQKKKKILDNVRAPRLGTAHDLFVFRQGRSGSDADHRDEEARIGGRRSRNGAGKKTGGELLERSMATIRFFFLLSTSTLFSLTFSLSHSLRRNNHNETTDPAHLSAAAVACESCCCCCC